MEKSKNPSDKIPMPQMIDRHKKSGRIANAIVSVILVMIYLLPIYVLLNLSLRTITDLTPRLYWPSVVTFDNYIQAFMNADLWKSMLNSAVYVVEVVAVEIVLGGLAAYGLARAGGKAAGALRTFNISIMMIPTLSLLVGTYSLMVKFNMVNKIWALSLQTAAMGMAGTIFFYTTFIVSIPKELDEAAAIDGAGIIRTYTQIIFPQMKAITITRIIMIAVGTWNNYAMPSYLLTNTKKATVILVVRKAFYTAAGAVQNTPLACAECAVAILPVMILYIALQHYIIEGQLDSISK
ncbi:MAG: carbohydrate ABC transporter permease [Lachnospiraceae bacterium]|nr:carbohydrate ABC transporter permease [Lachnospiraceae bacterium]